MDNKASNSRIHCMLQVKFDFRIKNFNLQSWTKLLENLYPSMHTIECNNTITRTTDLRYQIPPPQVNVSYKCLTIRVALEHTTTLLPRGRGKGGHGIVGMLGKMLCGCDIFSTVLSKIVDW